MEMVRPFPSVFYARYDRVKRSRAFRFVLGVDNQNARHFKRAGRIRGEKHKVANRKTNRSRAHLNSIRNVKRFRQPLPSDDVMQYHHTTGADVRRLVRQGEITGPTPGMALGYVQANLVIVTADAADDFRLFCRRNPKPCPLLEMTMPGDPEPKTTAPGADLRTDLPLYCIYEQGHLVRETSDLTDVWQNDFVAFLLGCSFTFENALLTAGLPVRHIEMGRNVPMYRTNIACRASGVFRGSMVVSMRPMTLPQAEQAAAICRRFPLAHGEPVHIGDPTAIGVRDIARPDYGDPVEICDGETPVFWACGVTPQAVVLEAKPPLVITHKPGHMFVTDLRDEDLIGKSGM